MFQPCNCCGCTLYSSALSNVAQFDSFDGGERYVSKFTLPEPDFQISFGNLLSSTVAINQLTSDWLYRDGRWFKLELVERPGQAGEVVHFEQTFRTARQSGFGPGTLFANAEAQAILEAPLPGITAPRNAHILYSEGTLGPLLHRAMRYIIGSTADGYIVDNLFTQRPLITGPFLRVRSDYLESPQAGDSLYWMGLPFGMPVGKRFFPYESRHLVPVPKELHIRCSFSEPKDGIISWSKIQNAERDRPESCPQNETCANAPRRNKPKWRLSHTSISNASFGNVDRHSFNGCLSQSRTAPTLFATPIVLRFRYTQITYRGIYGNNPNNNRLSQRRSSKLLSGRLDFEPSIQIRDLNASLVPSPNAGKQRVSLNASVDSLVSNSFVSGFGSTRDELLFGAWIDPVDGAVLGATLSPGWDVAEFGPAPPHQLIPAQNGQPLTSVSVVDTINATYQIVRDVTFFPRERTEFFSNTGYLVSRHEVSGGGGAGTAPGLVWQAEFDAYDTIDPPTIDIDGSMLTSIPPPFDAATSISAAEQRLDDDDVTLSRFRVAIGYRAINLNELTFTLEPFGEDSFS